MTEPLLATAFDADRMRAAGEVALDAIDESPVAIEPIARGNRKQTAVVRFPEREPVVLQVCPEPTWLRTESALLRALRRRTVVPVPPVLAADSHDGIGYMLTAYVRGEDLHEAFSAVESETRRHLARWFGRSLARLHDAFEFDGHGRLVLSNDALVSTGQDWGAWFREYGRRAVDRLPAAFDPLRDDLRDLVATPPDTASAALLFPWDFRPGNALIVDGSVTAVLDWEAPLAAAPALSVAKAEYLVADWYVADPDPLRRAFRDGYAAVRPTPSVRPAHRAVAIAASAVDSDGVVTNPRYPPVDRDDAVAFHRSALEAVLTSV